METFGFTYKTILFTWIKTDSKGNILEGKGNYTSPCTELLLIGTKGKIAEFFKGK